jgi:hypothetical protein
MAATREEPISATIEPTPRLTWIEFEKSPEYRHLSRKQKLWLIFFLATGDAIAATKSAFDAKPANLRSVAWKVERNDYVRSAIAKWRGQSERDKFLAELQAALDKCEPGSVAQARNLSLMARLKFGLNEEEEKDASKSAQEPELKFAVGDICVQDGVRYRVTSVDEHGKPLAADEVI